MLPGESFKFISPWGIQGPEKSGDLSEISQLLNSWAQIPTQIFWFQNVVKMLQVLTTCHWDSPVTAPPRIFFQITVPHGSCWASSILSLKLPGSLPSSACSSRSSASSFSTESMEFCKIICIYDNYSKRMGLGEIASTTSAIGILLGAQYPIRNVCLVLPMTALLYSSRKMAIFLGYNG